jgi:anaerobic selenocysteine-containing dehydrogenase
VLQYANEPVQQRRQGELTVVIHTRDAAARNIKTGDYVRVFNDRGSFEGRAQVSDDVLEGLAAARDFSKSLTRNVMTLIRGLISAPD